MIPPVIPNNEVMLLDYLIEVSTLVGSVIFASFLSAVVICLIRKFVNRVF